MIPYLEARGPYLLYGALILIGLYLVLTHRNLLKATIGLSIVQAGVLLFFIFLSVRRDGTVPIVDGDRLPPLDNPLPHALMLTAIVVGVSTVGVAFAILTRLQAEERSLDDAEGREA